MDSQYKSPYFRLMTCAVKYKKDTCTSSELNGPVTER